MHVISRAFGRAAAILVLAGGLILAATAQAATFPVTVTQDAGDANPGDGQCAVAAGGCSLRAAVQEATALPGEDAVVLPAGTFDLLSPLQFAATDARTTVTGAGRETTTVRIEVPRPAQGNLFVVDAGARAAAARVSLEARSGQGAMLKVHGELALDDVATGSSQTDGLLQVFGSARLRDVFVASVGLGPSISVLAGATLDWERGVLERSHRGVANSGTSQLTNVTLFENLGPSFSGTNIANHAGGVLSAVNVTVKAGDASNGGEPAVTNDPGGSLTMHNSIVEGMCVGSLTSLGGNVESGGSCGFTGAADAQNVDPQLGPLADNGGPTPTVAIAPTSPAVDRGSACPATDQRGVARGVPCDAGAYEIPDDRTPPVLFLPGPIAVDATGPAGALVTYAASATDAVDGPVPVSCAPASGTTFPIGTTTVACEASDARGNRATGSFTVTVRGAAAQIARLKDTVRSFNRPPLVTAALLTPLAAAEASLAHGRTGAACVSMGVFIAEARALSGSGLTPAQSARLVADATRIRAVLGCR